MSWFTKKTKSSKKTRKYILTKLGIKKGFYSDVRVGQSAHAPKLKVIRFVEPKELKVGDELYVGTSYTNYIKTSRIRSILKGTDNLTLETETSTYLLKLCKCK